MGRLFENRAEAGQRLAQELKQYRSHAVAMAVGCEGVAVAAEVARLLHLPLGMVPVVNLCGSGGETFGALASGGSAVVDWLMLERVGEEAARDIVAREQSELARLERIYVEFTHPPPAKRNLILISDGMATSLAVRAAVRALQFHASLHVIAAAPVVSASAERDLREEGCECVSLATVEPSATAGAWYREVRTATDSEALGQLELLARYARFTVA